MLLFFRGKKSSVDYMAQKQSVCDPVPCPSVWIWGYTCQALPASQLVCQQGWCWTCGSIRITAIKDRGFLVHCHNVSSFYLDPCHLFQWHLAVFSIQLFPIVVKLTISLLCSHKYGRIHWNGYELRLMLGHLDVIIHQVLTLGRITGFPDHLFPHL